MREHWSIAISPPKRRPFGAVLLSLFMAACSGTQTSLAPSAAPSSASEPSASSAASTNPAASAELSGHLVIWTNTGAPWPKVISAYEALHPNVTIDLVDKGGNLRGVYAAAITANQGPDLIAADAPAIVVQQREGSLELSSRITPDFKNSLNGWGAVTDPNTGQIWGVPFQLAKFQIYFDKAIFTKAGLDPANPPTTWPAMLAACEKIKAIKISCWGGGYALASWQLAAYWGMLGTRQQAIDLVYGRLKWTDEPVRTLVQRIIDLYNAGDYSPDWSGAALADVVAPFVAGKNGFIVYVPGFMSVPASGASDLGWTDFTHDDGSPADFTQGDAAGGWAITKWSKSPDLAWDFIQYASSVDGGNVNRDAGFASSVNKNVVFPLPGKDGFATFRAAWVQVPSDKVMVLPPMMQNPIQDELGKQVLAVITKQTTLDQALKAIQDVTDQNLPH